MSEYFKKMSESTLNDMREKYKESRVLWKLDELMNELGESLLRIGVNGTVHMSSLEESVDEAFEGPVVGYIKTEGRNVDLIQVEVTNSLPGGDGGYCYYVFHYVVQANTEGLEKKLDAEVKPVKKSFLSREVIDFRWQGGELTQRLNGDNELKNMILRGGLNQLPDLEVKPYRKTPWSGRINKDVRITKRPKTSSVRKAHEALEKTASFKQFFLNRYFFGHRVGVEFPTQETFEIYERISKHIRNIIAC